MHVSCRRSSGEVAESQAPAPSSAEKEGRPVWGAQWGRPVHGGHQEKPHKQGSAVMQLESGPPPRMGVSGDLDVLYLLRVQRGGHPYKWRFPL